MMDLLDVVCLLSVGFWLGAKFRERYESAPFHVERLAAVECSCRACQPSFLQESPAEAQ